MATKESEITAAPTLKSSDAEPTTVPTLTPEELVEATLFRLTQGLPRAELLLIISEAEACEAELMKEIELLEKAVEQQTTSNDNPEVKAIQESILTPLDQYWTASALLGRLRDDLTLPRIPTASGSPYTLIPPANSRHVPVEAAAFLQLQDLPAYTQKHEQPTQLLALYKKLSSHRSALVFRKPVKDEEAPGYSDRIHFKMDLGLIRKLITAGNIASYQEFHKYAALISHNCVKFNGRESDYGMLAREFEQAADEMIRTAVLGGTAALKSGTTPTAEIIVMAAAPKEAPTEPSTTTSTAEAETHVEAVPVENQMET